MRNIRIIFIIFSLLVIQNYVHAQDVSDYLITNDIGSYKKITKGGPSGNILAGADHFGLDHKDVSLGISYVNDETKMWIDVQVTQHAGADSDKWLLHEVDRNFRNYYGQPGDSYVMRQINGNTVMAAGSGEWTYHWLSANKVIRIEYTDLQMTKPEPLEVVQAYLAKHPSTLTPMTSADLRTADNKTKWIKDEMDRRLWLCDKWNAQFQLGKASQADMFRALVDNMTVFLKYRQKCYGITATDDINALFDYSRNNDAAAIMNKLTAYKTWWAANKGNAINL